MTILAETRERFLKAIAAQVDPAQIAEIHFFSPIKQGGAESGVAVIAAIAPVVPPTPVAPVSDEEPAADADSPEPASDEEATADAYSRGPASEDETVPDAEVAAPPTHAGGARHVIYTARYRLTLKGPDRGKWETNVVAEADAPIVTVDAVVRGVQRRAGDTDEAMRMDGAEVRAALEAIGRTEVLKL